MVNSIFSLPYSPPHSFQFRSIFQFRFVSESCPVVPLQPQPVAQGDLDIRLHITWPHSEVFKPFKQSPW